MKSKRLRSGYTTGACAAAAAKGATLALLAGLAGKRQRLDRVEIPFPDGSRHGFLLLRADFDAGAGRAVATVRKDAGDDPDVTNGAEIGAEATLVDSKAQTVGGAHPTAIRGGQGVGVVTRPGLPVPVGEPAINPVPRRMIAEAVAEAVAEIPKDARRVGCAHHLIETVGAAHPTVPGHGAVEITVFVPEGERLARHTLNSRLGIVGGLSILGTTGIVRPISAEAWTATITASFDVARAMGHREVVISSGRTSEKAHMRHFGLPEEAYVMVGDYLAFALAGAAEHGFARAHLAAQWAKLVKIAMGTPQTHVRHGALGMDAAVRFLAGLGVTLPEREGGYNTAREIFDILTASGDPLPAFIRVAEAARGYARQLAPGLPVTVHLISYDGRVLVSHG